MKGLSIASKMRGKPISIAQVETARVFWSELANSDRERVAFVMESHHFSF